MDEEVDGMFVSSRSRIFSSVSFSGDIAVEIKRIMQEMESCTFIEDMNDAASSSRVVRGFLLLLRAILNSSCV